VTDLNSASMHMLIWAIASLPVWHAGLTTCHECSAVSDIYAYASDCFQLVRIELLLPTRASLCMVNASLRGFDLRYSIRSRNRS